MIANRRVMSLLLILSGLSVAFAACNAPPLKLPLPLLSTPAPTSSPTPTPSPTPPPTPTPVPIEVAHQGERNLHNGDWDTAIQEFQAVIANPGAPADVRITAQIGLAHAALRRGDFTAAKMALDDFLNQYPTHPKAAQACFLRGDARMGLADWAGAISDFETYQSLRPGLLDSYVYERIADCHLALGQTEPALQRYDLALSSERYLVSELQLREKVASIARELGQVETAITHYQAILEKAQNYPYRASIEMMVGQTWFEAGQYDAAYEQFDRVFMTYPDTIEALNALRGLLDAGYDVDQYKRGLVNYYQEQYDIAIEAFQNYWGATQPSDYTPESYLYVARSYRALGNNSAALTQLQVFESQFEPDETDIWGDGWLEKADIFAAQGDAAAAYSAYEQLVAEHLTLTQAPEALYQAAQLAESMGDVQKAITYYQRLATEYPADTRSAIGLFDIGMRAYRNNDLSTAETIFNGTVQLASNERPAADYFWLGKTLNAAGRTEDATTAFNAAIAEEQHRYYGLRAAELLAGIQPFIPPANGTLPTDPDEGRAETEQWLVTHFGLSATPPLAEALRSDLAGDIRMVRGRELWDLGLVIEAKEDFESVRKDFQGDPLASYQLAIYFREIGLYRSSVLAAGSLFNLVDISPLEGPSFLARLRYPTYFSDLILAGSEQRSLDPLLVFSLIWQESIFEGFATSSASAQGLMQIWPPTGEDIAAKLAWPNYRPSDLQRPYVSVAFGTWLLRDELDRFDDDIYTTLAAYNAGTGRAAEWQAASAGDPDLYVEVITFSEPQAYIRRIYEHYAAYRALYGSP
ncbi:MAG: tetratricopeptide repeat protein [Anaerolineae bacterium]|nr:tetratricopeptide repeat protein [Anaerolineae bacterium]